MSVELEDAELDLPLSSQLSEESRLLGREIQRESVASISRPKVMLAGEEQPHRHPEVVIIGAIHSDFA
jgi:hypothetical protein